MGFDRDVRRVRRNQWKSVCCGRPQDVHAHWQQCTWQWRLGTRARLSAMEGGGGPSGPPDIRLRQGEHEDVGCVAWLQFRRNAVIGSRDE